MKSVETQLNEALDTIEVLTRCVASLKIAVHNKSITIVALQRDVRLKESKLSPDAVTRLHAAFAKSTNNDGLREAINVERRRTA